jgi:N utilization substance protein B
VNSDQRHRAREAALQILYHWQVGKSGIDRASETFFALQWPEDQPRPVEPLVDFATQLAADTVQRLPDIDTLIADTSERWRPERMAIIDRLILRLAVCELQRDPATPAAVVINEALELARTFSSEDSVKFINGMLDGIRGKLDRERS